MVSETKRRVPEVSSLVRLDRRANVLHRLSAGSWEELPGGGLRVNQKSPQFALRGFFDALCALAIREGYEVTFDGKLVSVFRGNEWGEVREWLTLTPTEAAVELRATAERGEVKADG